MGYVGLAVRCIEPQNLQSPQNPAQPVNKEMNPVANMYILPDSLLVGLVIVGVGLVIAESFLYYHLLPLRSFREWKRAFLEVMSLVLLIGSLYFPYEVLTLRGDGIPALHFLDTSRYIIAISGIVNGCYWLSRGAGSVYILGAAVLTIPLWDDFLPYTLCGAMFLLGWRIKELLPQAYVQYHQQITYYSIQHAIDSLDEGILVCKEKGEPVLVNRCMEVVMEKLLGTTLRNGNIFWHILQQGATKGVRWERLGAKMLFRLPSGESWILSREPIDRVDTTIWQITAANVTDLERINEELAASNQMWQERNQKMKDLLLHLVDIQSKETIRDIRMKVHDLMGQRISLLQQILNNKDVSQYKTITPLLDNLLGDMEKDISIDPAKLLSEMIHTYQDLGITVHVEGILPSQPQVSRIFVEIIREAMTNAICHGKANEISIFFTGKDRPCVQISDNGMGCQIPIQEGGGLSGARRKMKALGGTVRFKNQPHFTLILETGNLRDMLHTSQL